MKLFYGFLFSLLLLSCGGNSDKATNEKKKEDFDPTWIYQFFHQDPKNLAEREENAIIEYIVDKEIRVSKIPERSIYYAIEVEGKGPLLQPGEAVSVHYKGYFMDGRVFDSSYARGEPLKFKVGEMIPGWNIGLTRFKSGGKGKIFVPSRFAYGSRGLEGLVPPNTVLIFDVDILY
jgi:FKBP-type peptidyl-prolyl cis-trans isomerase FkpA/FKBP-type peptidyl-prolyl cis-trans isomerase FklB